MQTSQSSESRLEAALAAITSETRLPSGQHLDPHDLLDAPVPDSAVEALKEALRRKTT